MRLFRRSLHHAGSSSVRMGNTQNVEIHCLTVKLGRIMTIGARFAIHKVAAESLGQSLGPCAFQTLGPYAFQKLVSVFTGVRVLLPANSL